MRILCDYFKMKGYETVPSMSSVISVVAIKENLTKKIEGWAMATRALANSMGLKVELQKRSAKLV